MNCKQCGEEVEALVSVKVGSKRRKVCEECADKLREDGEIAEAATGAMQQMMEYKGR
jgi:protein-arginine kinase activator protein McsA